MEFRCLRTAAKGVALGTPVPFFEKKGTQKAQNALRGLTLAGRFFS